MSLTEKKSKLHNHFQSYNWSNNVWNEHKTQNLLTVNLDNAEDKEECAGHR